MPQSLNFSHNYLALKEKKPISKTFADEENFSIDSKERNLEDADKSAKNMRNSKILSSRLSGIQLFQHKNSYFNEKIMRFNCVKNEDSFRINQSEFIIEKPAFVLDKNEGVFCEKKEEIFAEIHKEKYQFFQENEVKFTENTVKSEENEENDENFTDSWRNEEKIRGFFRFKPGISSKIL